MKENIVGKILSRIPYIRYAYFYRRYCNHRPGHFYSPVVNLDELDTKREKIWRNPKNLPGIDLNEEKQVSLLPLLTEAAKSIPFTADPDPAFRYYFDNKTYAFADGLVLFTILTAFKP